MSDGPAPATRRHRQVLLGLGAMLAGMFAFGFALVPLYNVVCRLTGLNGRGVETVASAYAGEVDEGRSVTVQFLSTVNSKLPFEFHPDAGALKVHPGELYGASFYAENQSGADVTAQAVATYAPGEAAKYVHKTECFCFSKESFGPHESKHMPVRFYIDPALPKDIGTVTISYTYYNVTPGHAPGA
ncbi:MAG TPA: cytochrome c oxidase assembly protein [Gammaproteobacteria bacterium]|jgi:cytochrome c oxidase assembly protein subunit 11|nr:cytochrome c oxidase assembly protein [Gammaproteobacteria bacterium]